ncbi:hypothetical protein PPHE_a0615 [Pseudoalteromonas phenolica O-BC30]|nr:hypothetical protein [Pseudoalteromonas phenolica O-BC30]
MANLEIEDSYRYFQRELVLLLLERLPLEHMPPACPNL